MTYGSFTPSPVAPPYPGQPAAPWPPAPIGSAAFTRAQMAELREAKDKVARLEKLEATALKSVAGAFSYVLGSTDGGPLSSEQLRAVVANAETIRDALAPFDSGTRPAPAIPDTPNVTRGYAAAKAPE